LGTVHSHCDHTHNFSKLYSAPTMWSPIAKAFKSVTRESVHGPLHWHPVGRQMSGKSERIIAVSKKWARINCAAGQGKHLWRRFRRRNARAYGPPLRVEFLTRINLRLKDQGRVDPNIAYASVTGNSGTLLDEYASWLQDVSGAKEHLGHFFRGNTLPTGAGSLTLSAVGYTKPSVPFCTNLLEMGKCFKGQKCEFSHETCDIDQEHVILPISHEFFKFSLAKWKDANTFWLRGEQYNMKTPPCFRRASVQPEAGRVHYTSSTRVRLLTRGEAIFSGFSNDQQYFAIAYGDEAAEVEGVVRRVKSSLVRWNSGKEGTGVDSNPLSFCPNLIQHGYCQDMSSCKYTHDLSYLSGNHAVLSVDKQFFYETLETKSWKEREQFWLDADGGGSRKVSSVDNTKIRLINGKTASLGNVDIGFDNFFIVVHGGEMDNIQAVEARVMKSYGEWKKDRPVGSSQTKSPNLTQPSQPATSQKKLSAARKTFCPRVLRSGSCHERKCTHSHDLVDLKRTKEILPIDGGFIKEILSNFNDFKLLMRSINPAIELRVLVHGRGKQQISDSSSGEMPAKNRALIFDQTVNPPRDSVHVEAAAKRLRTIHQKWKTEKSAYFKTQINQPSVFLTRALKRENYAKLKEIERKSGSLIQITNDSMGQTIEISSLEEENTKKALKLLERLASNMKEHVLEHPVSGSQARFLNYVLAQKSLREYHKSLPTLVEAIIRKSETGRGSFSLEVSSLNVDVGKTYQKRLLEELEQFKRRYICLPNEILVLGRHVSNNPKSQRGQHPLVDLWKSRYGKFNSQNRCFLESIQRKDYMWTFCLAGRDEDLVREKDIMLNEIAEALRIKRKYPESVQMSCSYVNVPANAGAALVGKAGSVIQAMTVDSGAIIKFPHFLTNQDASQWSEYTVGETVHPDMFRVMLIIGTKEQTAAAESMIEGVVEAHKVNMAKYDQYQKRKIGYHHGGGRNRIPKQSAKEKQLAVLKERAGETVLLSDEMTVLELASRMKMRSQFLRFQLRDLGEHRIKDDSVLSLDTAELLVLECGMVPTFEGEDTRDFQRADKSPEADQNWPSRPPVLTIMGHVDHGKTTLLDTLRKSSIADGEAGGITQSVGGFVYAPKKGAAITFIDTPGHSAFTAMRQTGVNAADINVVVVAAEDGVMPQTIEALEIAQRSGLPLIVLITKIDKDGVSADESKRRIEGELLKHGVVSEDMGGEVPIIPVSAISGEGLDDFVEAAALHAEILELKGPNKVPAEGLVLESSVERGQGVVTDVLVRWGRLKRADFVVAGEEWGRIKRITNDKGKAVKFADPSSPVRVLGFRSMPTAGVEVFAVESEARAQEIVEYRQEMRRKQRLANDRVAAKEKAYMDRGKKHLLKRVRFAGPRTNNEKKDIDESEDDTPKSLNIIFKGGTAGALNAIELCVSECIVKTGIQANLIRLETGEISSSDVLAAVDAGAIIYGFNTKITKEAKQEAKKHGVEIYVHKIIYKVQDDLLEKMSNLLPTVYEERSLGKAEVLQTFEINGSSRGKKLQINGMKVSDGKLEKNKLFRIKRGDTVIYDNLQAGSMKIFKDEASLVGKGGECGLQLLDELDSLGVKLEPQDMVECYEFVEVKRQSFEL
jgi:translation initiation factor IF-2